MHISDNYIDEIVNFEKLSNSQFMALQIWYLKHVFNHDIAAIKNKECEFVAFTRDFAEEFDVTEELLGKTSIAIPSDFENKVYDEIMQQEKQIIKDTKLQDSIYLHKSKDVVSIYAVRKRPLVNPHTGETLGLLINTAKFIPNSIRKVLDEHFLHLPQNTNNIPDKGLSKLQQQIVFCLLLGFASRKEIANALSNYTGNEFNEIQVKNALQALYLKFECNTPNQLIDLVVNGTIKLDIPADMLPAGVFPVKGFNRS